MVTTSSAGLASPSWVFRTHWITRIVLHGSHIRFAGEMWFTLAARGPFSANRFMHATKTNSYVIYEQTRWRVEFTCGGLASQRTKCTRWDSAQNLSAEHQLKSMRIHQEIVALLKTSLLCSLASSCIDTSSIFTSCNSYESHDDYGHPAYEITRHHQYHMLRNSNILISIFCGSNN